MTYVKTLLGLGLLVAALSVTGCGGGSAPAENAKQKSGGGHDHAHTHGSGPNGGVVFDLGKYHAEFTVDHPKQECTVLVLGDDMKSPEMVGATEFTLNTKPTKTEDGTEVPAMTVTLKPQDAADGKASTFVGTDPGIGNVADFEGTVVGEIDGKPSQGSFKE